MSAAPDWHLDPRLAAVCTEAGLPVAGLRGICAAAGGGAGCVVAVSELPPPPGGSTDAALAAARTALAGALGVAELELILATGPTVRAVVRDWLYQAAQGSGRGVSMRLEERAGPGAAPVLEVLVDSPDSSAREVALRLGTPRGRLAVEALAGVLQMSAVEVREAPAG